VREEKGENELNEYQVKLVESQSRNPARAGECVEWEEGEREEEEEIPGAVLGMLNEMVRGHLLIRLGCWRETVNS